MTVFWVVAAALGLGVAATLARALLQRNEAPARSYDMQVYRDQLKDVDRDLVRGTIAPEEAERLRTEVSRRLLDADKVVVVARGPGGAVIGLGLVVAMLAGAYAIYWRLGAPGYPDLPLAGRIEMTEAARAQRPSQAVAVAAAPTPQQPEMDAGFIELMGQLRAAVAAKPDDLRGQQLLARNEAGLGNFAAAAEAQSRVVELGDGNAADRAALAEMMILAANGYVSPEAERVLSEALARDPENPLALYYSGLMMAQGGRDDLAFRLWRGALQHAPEGAGYVPTILSAMPDLAARAGVRWDGAPAPMVGPSAEQIEAMSALDPADRSAAIEGMVRQLNDRLASRGGTADEWARLIAAYGVLGQQDRAAQIWSEARQIFTNDGEQAIVRAAAEQAGVAE